jgi:hypothetical protein
MRFLLRVSAILLTLSTSVYADGTTATCSSVQAGTRDLGWLDDLSRELNAKVKAPVVDLASPTPTPPPLIKVVDVPSEKPVVKTSPPEESDRYDMVDPELARLRKSAIASATKCRKGICGSNHSKYFCYRGVKEALVNAGMVDRFWSEEAASDAHDKHSLDDRGFKNLITEGYNTSNAPLGAVLVYSGGKYRCHENGRRKTCGHIEIKLSSNKFCSDYCKTSPADHYLARKLIGVYVKE